MTPICSPGTTGRCRATPAIRRRRTSTPASTPRLCPLARRAAGRRALSLYLHIPFCDSCAGSAAATRGWCASTSRSPPICACWSARSTWSADATARSPPCRPHALRRRLADDAAARDDLAGSGGPSARRFDSREDAEIAVEIDPRDLDAERRRRPSRRAASPGPASASRTSTRRSSGRSTGSSPSPSPSAPSTWLRDAGIARPQHRPDVRPAAPDDRQVEATVDAVAELGPDRIALFGYAHVPWMKRHQRLIPEAALPDAVGAGTRSRPPPPRLGAAGYWRSASTISRGPTIRSPSPRREGRLHRNFQGYTTDEAAALLGFGASAIGEPAPGLRAERRPTAAAAAGDPQPAGWRPRAASS